MFLPWATSWRKPFSNIAHSDFPLKSSTRKIKRLVPQVRNCYYQIRDFFTSRLQFCVCFIAVELLSLDAETSGTSPSGSMNLPHAPARATTSAQRRCFILARRSIPNRWAQSFLSRWWLLRLVRSATSRRTTAARHLLKTCPHLKLKVWNNQMFFPISSTFMVLWKNDDLVHVKAGFFPQPTSESFSSL